jgi:hypothetical protein
MSPPLPPQMSPDNGRPLHHLEQTTSQRLTSENINQIQVIQQCEIFGLFYIDFLTIESSY